MHCKIYLFRHGQTYFNEEHRFTGWKDSQLAPQGIKDAKKLAQKLKSKKFQVAFQTRLSRSKDTLKYILQFHPECKKIITDDRMIERNYGILEGKFHRTIIKEYGEKKFNLWHRSYTIAPQKGETIKQVEKRVLAFIKDLITYMEKNKVNVAISAHGNSMRPFREYFEKLSKKQMMTLENPWDDYFEYKIKV